jgi:hypothetical protein
LMILLLLFFVHAPPMRQRSGPTCEPTSRL